MLGRRTLLITVGLMLIAVLCVTAASQVQDSNIQVLFSLVDSPQAAIVRALDGAGQTVHIAMYYFTDAKLAEAVVRAHQRGVQTYVYLDKSQVVYLDKSQVNQQSAQARYLAERSVPVRISSNSAIMHNKFAIIDGSTVITGSYNWTKSAYQRNDENLLIIRRPDVAQRYMQRFAGLWMREFDLAATQAVRAN